MALFTDAYKHHLASRVNSWMKRNWYSCPGSTSCVSTSFVSHIDDLMQDGSNSSALAMELLQACTKPSISFVFQFIWVLWFSDHLVSPKRELVAPKSYRDNAKYSGHVFLGDSQIINCYPLVPGVGLGMGQVIISKLLTGSLISELLEAHLFIKH